MIGVYLFTKLFGSNLEQLEKNYKQALMKEEMFKYAENSYNSMKVEMFQDAENSYNSMKVEMFQDAEKTTNSMKVEMFEYAEKATNYMKEKFRIWCLQFNERRDAVPTTHESRNV